MENAAYQELGSVQFPAPSDRMVNMMPVVVGDPSSVPRELCGYWRMMDLCGFEPGTTAYLTINESLVRRGESQRRPGIHTDGTALLCHGGGSPAPAPGHGGGRTGGEYQEGMCMASTDGAARLWDVIDLSGGKLGELEEPPGAAIPLRRNRLYWMTDRTPHEGTKSDTTGYRQFFRLTAQALGIWYSRHNTANPLGVQPGCLVSHDDKFHAGLGA